MCDSESQINDLSKLLPDSLKIPSSHMSLSSAPIGQGRLVCCEIIDCI